MTFYVTIRLSPSGAVDANGTIERVQGRAAATEVGMTDAASLQKKAKKKWPDCEWQIDRTYSGKHVIRGQANS
jgi:hypothetical protein